jgi:hypothetical protein
LVVVCLFLFCFPNFLRRVGFAERDLGVVDSNKGI